MTTPRLTLDRIVDATLEIGVDVATTSSVARRLGVEQPALYRHVGSKAELLDLSADRALSSLADWSASGAARHDVPALQTALWAAFDAYAGLSRHLLVTTVLPVSLQSAAGRLASSVCDSGIPVVPAVLVVDGVVHLTIVAHAGSERLRDGDTARRWRERTAIIEDGALLSSVRELEEADALDLALRQGAMLLAGAPRASPAASSPR